MQVQNPGRAFKGLICLAVVLLLFLSWLFGLYLRKPLFYNDFDILGWRDGGTGMPEAGRRWIRWDSKSNMIAFIDTEDVFALQGLDCWPGYAIAKLGGTDGIGAVDVRIDDQPDALVIVNRSGVRRVRALKPGEARSIFGELQAYALKEKFDSVKVYEMMRGFETATSGPAR